MNGDSSQRQGYWEKKLEICLICLLNIYDMVSSMTEYHVIFFRIRRPHGRQEFFRFWGVATKLKIFSMRFQKSKSKGAKLHTTIKKIGCYFWDSGLRFSRSISRTLQFDSNTSKKKKIKFLQVIFTNVITNCNYKSYVPVATLSGIQTFLLSRVFWNYV